MIIEGYACHFGKVNGNGEEVTQRAFDECLLDYHNRNRRPMLTYNHEEGNIIGKIERLVPDKVGLWMRAQLFEEMDTVRNFILPLMRGGVLDSFSTEGYIRREDYVQHHDGTYTANKVFLTAVSVVPIPADNDARFRVANSFTVCDSVDFVKVKNALLGYQERKPYRPFYYKF